MPGGAPGPIESVERPGQRLGHDVPRGGARVGGDGLHCGARGGEQLIDGRRDVFGADGVETRQAIEIEQRIVVRCSS